MNTLLTATALTRRYRQLCAVDHIDLTLSTADRHALIGPNGAGKTTLLGMLAGTIRPTGGRITLRGKDITHTGPARRARLGISRTFQTPAVLPSLSTLDNLVIAALPHYPRATAWTRRHRRTLWQRGLHQLDRLGLAAHANRPAAALSHGQQRLLDLAIALAAQPDVLLLDEPAAGLGDTDLPHLLAALGALPPEVAVLLVEHNQDVVTAFADTVTVLHHGTVLATGTPQAIHDHPGVRSAYLGATPSTARLSVRRP